MKFNPEKKDLLPTGKTETTANEQDLGWEELSDEAAAAIQGGARYYSASNPKQRRNDYSNLTALAGG